MAIQGANDEIIVGGAYNAGGTQEGVYRIKVTDAAIRPSSKKQTPQLSLTLHGNKDPDHPTKEGKLVAFMNQTLPNAKQDEEKRKDTQGFLKRLCYDGFGVEWPKAGKKFDPRIFADKEAWVLIKKDTKDEQGRTKVVAVAVEREKLPVQRGAEAVTTKKKATAAAAAAR